MSVEKPPTPPYVPYLTMKNFIAGIHDSAAPDKIDRSVLGKLSGAMQIQLLSALRFLKWIDATGTTSETLVKLRKAYNTETWAAVLKEALIPPYKPITEHINLHSASSQQLKDAFRDKGGVESQMLEKAIRFFIKAMQDAKVPLSTYILQKKPRAPRVKSQRDNGNNSTAGPGPMTTPSTHAPVVGTIVIPLYIPGKPTGSVTIPEDLTDEDCDMINDFVRAYAKRRAVKRDGAK